MSFLVEGVNKNLEPKAQVRRIGEYEKVEEAIAAAKRTIDEFLRREFKPGMDAKALFFGCTRRRVNIPSSSGPRTGPSACAASATPSTP